MKIKNNKMLFDSRKWFKFAILIFNSVSFPVFAMQYVKRDCTDMITL